MTLTAPPGRSSAAIRKITSAKAQKGYVNIKGIYEFDAENRPSGWTRG